LEVQLASYAKLPTSRPFAIGINMRRTVSH
jgi:hypothetical protein